MKYSSIKRWRSSETIASFWEKYQMGKINLNPKYQRRSVWSEDKQAYFINSIINNFPVPPIFASYSLEDDRIDIIDGKQRLTAIKNFIEGKIPHYVEYEEEVTFSRTKTGSGEYLRQLSYESARDFWSYEIGFEYIDGFDDEVITQVFERLNNSGERLTGQELRNNRYNKSRLISFISDIKSSLEWKGIKLSVSQARAEEDEFISELFFLIHTKRVQSGTARSLESLWKKYHDEIEDEDLRTFFRVLLEFHNLDIDLKKLRASTLSNFYAIFSAILATFDGVGVGDLSRIKKFFERRAEILGNKRVDFDLLFDHDRSGLITEYELSRKIALRSIKSRAQAIKYLCIYCGIKTNLIEGADI